VEGHHTSNVAGNFCAADIFSNLDREAVMKLHHAICRLGMPVVTLALLASCGGGYGDSGTAYTPPAPAPAPAPSPTTEQYTATLLGSSEAAPNPSAATATGTVTVNTTTKSMTASVSTTGIAGTMAHIHEGPVGVSGPIIFPLLEASYAGSGTWSTTVTLTDAQLATLRAGNYYFNVHSVAYPNGEIRGQIKP
jgi:hypothetical protein